MEPPLALASVLLRLLLRLLELLRLLLRWEQEQCWLHRALLLLPWLP